MEKNNRSRPYSQPKDLGHRLISAPSVLVWYALSAARRLCACAARGGKARYRHGRVSERWYARSADATASGRGVDATASQARRECVAFRAVMTKKPQQVSSRSLNLRLFWDRYCNCSRSGQLQLDLNLIMLFDDLGDHTSAYGTATLTDSKTLTGCHCNWVD